MPTAWLSAIRWGTHPSCIPASDPVVLRSEGIAGSPQSAAHGADGLASGSATACGAELEDAQDGGSCGSVRYCVGAGCETVSSQSNTGFVNATTRLNMAVELGGEEFDRDNLEFYKGTRQRCHIHFGGLSNCCKSSGLLVGLAHDRPHRRRGTRDGGPDAARRRSGPRAHAGLGGAGASPQGSAHGRPEGGREADPVGEGPHGRHPGLCRHRQDHHAEPGQGARGEEGLAHDRPRAVCVGGADAGLRSRDRDRDPAAVPRPQCRRRRGAAHEEGREGNARRLREDRPGGRRGLARLHRAGKGPAAHRQRGGVSPGSFSSATRSSSTRSMPASPSPSSRPPACRPLRWTRSCASAIPP